MTPADLISMYEHIANITNEMVVAARSNNWDVLSKLEDQCARQTRRIEENQVPALTGTPRERRLVLLKQILANDRAIREITEPWMTQVANVMQGASKQQRSEAVTH